jgi:uncharacterized membrane protein
MAKLSTLLSLASVALSAAFTLLPQSSVVSYQLTKATGCNRAALLQRRADGHTNSFDPLHLTTAKKAAAGPAAAPSAALAAATAIAWSAGAAPAQAFATSDTALPSAFAAYGHYLGLALSVGCLVTERLTVKAGMSEDEEKRLVMADSVYGLAAVLILVTGYQRVVAYGKGWDFYAHEPIFWVKLWLLSVMGAASFFPTTQIIKRAVGPPPGPMSEKLAARMTSIINAELLAIGSIPLAATLMARGVGYADGLPWQAGAAPVALTLVGLGFKYIKEALDWQEDEA